MYYFDHGIWFISFYKSTRILGIKKPPQSEGFDCILFGFSFEPKHPLL